MNAERLAGRFRHLLVAGLLWPAVAAGQVEQRLTAAPDARVNIRSSSGSVTVVGTNRNEILIRGVGGDGQTSTRVNAGEFDVTANTDALRIDAPVGSRLRITTSSGAIDVRGFSGDIEIGSMSGSVRVTGEIRTLQAETVSGDIVVDGIVDVVRARTVSGQVRVPRARRSAELGSVSGTVHLTADGLREGRLSNVSGPIRFDGRFAADAVLSFENSSGLTEIHVAAGVPADYSLSAVAGTITNAFGPSAQASSGFGAGHQLRFSTARGGARIDARTVSGAIRLIEP